MNYVFPPAPIAAVPLLGGQQALPIHRIYCVGRNYAEHAQEMGHSGREPPFFFMKPADAVRVCPPDETVALPYPSLTDALHHEVELVVAIGMAGSDIPVAQALQHVLGYAVGLDMTRRDLQNALKSQGRPWCIAKGFDHSAPVGFITLAADVPDIAQAHISLSVNGQRRQQGQISQLIWSVAETVAQLSAGWRLEPGDLIYTGTPAGVGAVQRGDLLQAGVTGLAPLACRII